MARKPDDKTPDDKLFSRSEYRRVIAWPERIRREAPFLERVLAPAPCRRVLDVGCGTGEHTRHLASQGWEAVGIDVSEDMIADAAGLAGPTERGGSARFDRRAAAAAPSLPEAPFGAAICLGNTLAFVENDEQLDSFLGGVSRALAPGAPFLLQVLNYERIERLPVRALPVNVRPLPEGEGDGEIVFVRILRARGDRTIDFYPITLTLEKGEEPRVTVRSARHVVHRAWTRAELEPRLAAASLPVTRTWGGMDEVPFSPEESPDLVLLARRQADR